MLVLGVLLCVWCFAMPDQVLCTWSGGMANGTRRIPSKIGYGGEGGGGASSSNTIALRNQFCLITIRIIIGIRGFASNV